MCYVEDIRFIHTHSLLRVELLCMTEVYNMYMYVLMYTEDRVCLLHVISSLELILLIRYKS